jgi:hypothetical protein
MSGWMVTYVDLPRSGNAWTLLDLTTDHHKGFSVGTQLNERDAPGLHYGLCSAGLMLRLGRQAAGAGGVGQLLVWVGQVDPAAVVVSVAAGDGSDGAQLDSAGLLHWCCASSAAALGVAGF